MQRRRRLLSFAAALGLVLSLVAPSATFAAGGVTGSLHGRVSDAANASLGGVAVTASSPSGTYKTTTDSSGGFNFLSIPTDTYIVSFEKPGFQSRSFSGVTVLGDATVDLGQVTLGKELQTIGRVTARSPISAFNPSQTQDSYTVSGQRIQQALGNPQSTNEAQLLQSVPGIIPTFDSTNGVGLSVRGSLAVELGYQYDGVPFTAPFFDANASQGYLNNLGGGSGGSLQVVSGAGDATQAGSAGGVINTVVSRGTYPGTLTLDSEVGGPFYDHALNINWSTASPDGRISNYFAYSGSRFVPQFVPYGASSSQQVLAGLTGTNNGSYYQTGYVEHDDITDNAVFKFGRNNNQSIQVLERNADLKEFAGYGGLTGLQYYNSSPSFLENFSSQFPGTTVSQQNSYLAKLLSPTTDEPPQGYPVTQADETSGNPLQFLKLEYTNNINASTYLSLSYYNWQLYQGGTNYAEYPVNGPFATAFATTGGSRTGGILSLTKTIGDNQTLTLEGKYEGDRPEWDNQSPADGLYVLEGAFGPTGPEQPQPQDWYLPANTSAPVSATNPCIGPGNTVDASGCYLYSQLLAAGKWTGTLPTIPNFGINYHGTLQQQWGVGFRDQYSPTDKLHLDLGVRVDGEQNLFGPDQLQGTTPSDVSPAKLGNDFLRPREVEPRAAISYQLGQNDSIRASYGRSVEFFFGQTLGTPFNLTGLNPVLYSIPAQDSISNPGCGSGTHGPGPGYSVNPNNYQSGANGGNPAYFFKCTSYAQALASLYDQFLDAPDLGGYGPPVYNNFDFSYSHQFSKGFLRGWATHATAYERSGFNVEQNVLLLNGPPNPITGQSAASVFSTVANGSERAFGIEEQITTPDIPRGRAGASGYLTFDYINEYTTTPPIAGSSNLPILQGQLLQTNEYFRAGFVPPVTISSGFTYQFKNGVKVTPSLLANFGYPFGVGRTAFGFVNGVLTDIPETNYGVNTPFAGASGPGNAYNASFFVDPQVPGSSLNPNIVSSRGNNEPALAGNATTPPQAYLNINLEYPVDKNFTLGFTAFNVTNNVYGVPSINTLYQPVAKGVAGPQTGKTASANPLSPSYQYGAGNEINQIGGYLPYLNGYGPGISYNGYLRFKI